MDAMLHPSAWLRSVLVPSTPSLRHPRLIEARLSDPSLHIHSFHQLFSTTRVPKRSPSALHYLRGSSAIPLKPYTWRTPLSVTPSYPQTLPAINRTTRDTQAPSPSTPSYQAPSFGPHRLTRRLSPTSHVPLPLPGICVRHVPFPTVSPARMARLPSPPHILLKW